MNQIKWREVWRNWMIFQSNTTEVSRSNDERDEMKSIRIITMISDLLAVGWWHASGYLLSAQNDDKERYVIRQWVISASANFSHSFKAIYCHLMEWMPSGWNESGLNKPVQNVSYFWSHQTHTHTYTQTQTIHTHCFGVFLLSVDVQCVNINPIRVSHILLPISW